MRTYVFGIRKLRLSMNIDKVRHILTTLASQRRVTCYAFTSSEKSIVRRPRDIFITRVLHNLQQLAERTEGRALQRTCHALQVRSFKIYKTIPEIRDDFVVDVVHERDPLRITRMGRLSPFVLHAFQSVAHNNSMRGHQEERDRTHSERNLWVRTTLPAAARGGRAMTGRERLEARCGGVAEAFSLPLEV